MTEERQEPRRSVFPGLGDRSQRRRAVVGDLADERRRLGLSQTEVAERMRTSQSAVARLEAGDGDVRLSTLERYADAVGRSLDWRLGEPRGERPGDRPGDRSGGRPDQGGQSP